MPAALVIGARNLGFAVIERLLSDGWTVAGAARSPETLAKVRGAGAEALDVDVTDQGSVLAALQHLGARHGRVDLAVNAASPYGGSRSGPFGGGPLAHAAPTSFDDWATLPARGAFGFLSACARFMSAQGGPLIDHSFADAVTAFTRINSLGVRLKQQDIESAHIAATHSGLIADEVVPFTEELSRLGFTRLTAMHLFRVCAFVARPDGRARTPLHELPRPEVLKAWEQTEKATTAACGLVRSELGLMNMDILWSGALLVPVIAMLATMPSRTRSPEAMMAWLALASLLHRYSGSSETALDQDLRACRDDDPIGGLLRNLRQHRPSLLARPQDFAGTLSDRSGLLAVYIACKHRGIRDFFTGQKILLHGDIDRHHILPRRQFPEVSRSQADNVANIAFITSEVNKAISHTGPEVYIGEIDSAILESQCVPPDRSLWNINMAESFYAARRKLLAESFNEFLRGALPGRKL